MKTTTRLMLGTVSFVTGLATAPALSQTAISATATGGGATSSSSSGWGNALDRDVNRDVSQQNRIESGVQSGALTDKEASQLEKGESRIDHTEAHDARNGLSPQEQARISAEQKAESKKITVDDNNGATTSTPNARVETDVQRDANQQKRIANGVKSGALTDKEASRLENGQAALDATDASKARHDGISTGQQRHISKTAYRNSAAIYAAKHNGQSAGAVKTNSGAIVSPNLATSANTGTRSANAGTNATATTAVTGSTVPTSNATPNGSTGVTNADVAGTAAAGQESQTIQPNGQTTMLPQGGPIMNGQTSQLGTGGVTSSNQTTQLPNGNTTAVNGSATATTNTSAGTTPANAAATPAAPVAHSGGGGHK